MERELAGGAGLDYESPLHWFHGYRWFIGLFGVDLRFILGSNINNLIYRLFSMVAKMEDSPIIKATLGKQPKIHLNPQIWLSFWNILNQLRLMPRKHFSMVILTATRRFQADNSAISYLFGAINQVIDIEAISIYSHDGIVLWVDLPITVIIEYIEILYCLLGCALPALEANEEAFDLLAVIGVV